MTCRERKSECPMFLCEAEKMCKFPDNCDDKGFITGRRFRTAKEQKKKEKEDPRAIGEDL